MTIVVFLQEIVDAIDAYGDDTQSYLNRKTGEVYAISDEDILTIEDDDPGDELPEWEREMIEKTHEILDGKGDIWLPLPDKFEIHEYSIMEDFSTSYSDENISNDLMRSIRGAGAFRYFKDTLYRYEIADKWYSYRQSALEAKAKDWLDEHKIEYKTGRRII